MTMTNDRTDEVVEVVRARRFELVDDNGHVAATLGVEDWSGGGPVLALSNPQGKKLVTIGAFRDEGEIDLTTAEYEGCVTVGLGGSSGLYEAPAISS